MMGGESGEMMMAVVVVVTVMDLKMGRIMKGYDSGNGENECDGKTVKG